MACNMAIVDFGEEILNTLNCIRFSSLLVSILYIFPVLLWLVLISNLVNITNLTLSKLKYMILTESKFLPLSFCLLVLGSCPCRNMWTALFLCGDLWLCLSLCVLLHTALQLLPFQHLLHILTYARHCFSR